MGIILLRTRSLGVLRHILLLAVGLLSHRLCVLAVEPVDVSNLTIAIVNAPNFHYDVLAGVLEVFKPYRDSISVFVNGHATIDGQDSGIREFLSMHGYNGTDVLHALPATPTVGHFDFVLCMSAEFVMIYCTDFLRHTKPLSVMVIVHEPHKEIAETHEGVVAALEELHPNVLLAGLSPHVVQCIRDRVGRPAFWYLGVPRASEDVTCPSDAEAAAGASDSSSAASLTGAGGGASSGEFAHKHRNNNRRMLSKASPLLASSGNAAATVSAATRRGGAAGSGRKLQEHRHHVARSQRAADHEFDFETERLMSPALALRQAQLELPLPSSQACPKYGFVLPGSLDPERRNYTKLWEEMTSLHHTAGTEDMPMVTVLGARLDRPGMRRFVQSIPDQLVESNRVHLELDHPFCKYYSVVRCSTGLLTMFASRAYYEAKYSSTISTSLITGTPMIMTQPALAAHSFFDQRSVFVQHEHENIAQAMQRMMVLSHEELAAMRKAVLEVREAVNRRADFCIADLMRALVAAKAQAEAADAAGQPRPAQPIDVKQLLFYRSMGLNDYETPASAS